jgi:penicillin-binding protein 1C
MEGTLTTRRPIRPRQILAAVGLGVFVAGLFALRLGLSAIDDIRAGLPPAPDLATLPTSQVVVDRDGRLLRPFTTADGRWRLPVSLEEVDPRFIAMLLAYEDGRFRDHHGVDWWAMSRAAAQFVMNGRIVSGGSTLTMQVARLIEEEPTRSLSAKIAQMVHARALERDLTKDEILGLYLALAPYGGNIEGIRAATLAYFGKEPGRLTPAEAALLVALPQSPEARRPDRFPEVARAARDRVLDRLVVAGILDAEEAEAAKRERVPMVRRDFPILAPHLAQEAIAMLPAERVIPLTVSRQLQAALERLAATRANALGPKLSVAILVADHRSGEILASVGSANLLSEERDGHVDMTAAIRSPGSALKPLIYGLGFELGLAHPESLIEDRPTGFGGYVPENFDGFHRGTVTIREALTQSLNAPAVIVLDAVGPARLVSRLERAGAVPTLPDVTAPGLAIGLGGVGVTLRDLVSMYAAIAHGGYAVSLRDGIHQPGAQNGALVLDPVSAWYVADILADVPPPLNGSPGRIAYKTGTSYGYRDAWAIGFDGRYVIGVWVGRPDGTPVSGLSGIASAAPILFESFDRLGVQATPLPPAPSGVLFASNATLPEPLRRFRHPDEDVVARNAAPEISFPLDGVEVDLGVGTGNATPLMIKVRNGAPPFTFFANGAPFGRSAFARATAWDADGPGYVTLSVIDANGRSDRVTVFVE